MSDKELIKQLEEVIVDKHKEIERLTKQNKALNEMYELTKKEYIRLNNIINELEEWLESESNFWKEQQEKAIKNGWLEFGGKYNTTIIYEDAINKLQELKGSDKE